MLVLHPGMHKKRALDSSHAEKEAAEHLSCHTCTNDFSLVRFGMCDIMAIEVRAQACGEVRISDQQHTLFVSANGGLLLCQHAISLGDDSDDLASALNSQQKAFRVGVNSVMSHPVQASQANYLQKALSNRARNFQIIKEENGEARVENVVQLGPLLSIKAGGTCAAEGSSRTLVSLDDIRAEIGPFR